MVVCVIVALSLQTILDFNSVYLAVMRHRRPLLLWLSVAVTAFLLCSLLDVPFLLRRIRLILRRISVHYFSAKVIFPHMCH